MGFVGNKLKYVIFICTRVAGNLADVYIAIGLDAGNF